VAYAASAFITIPANPEIKFWSSVVQKRDQEIAAIRKQNPNQPILFFTGGSSCAFSIDPQIIEEICGLPAFNLGLPVSAGPKYLLHQALEKARAGDIIVIALEPDTLTYQSDYEVTSLTLGLAIKDRDPSGTVGGRSFNESLAFRDWLNLTRPGPGYIANYLGKAVTGKGYRYKNEDIRYHGRIETQVSDPNLPQAGRKSVTEICSSGRALLTKFKQAASQKNVSLFYSMPWVLNDKEAANHNREANRKIQESILPIMPVVDDGHQGVAIDSTFFSDSGLHLSAKGSSQRSIALGEALQHRLASHVSK
jgi:hypothetical protein